MSWKHCPRSTSLLKRAGKVRSKAGKPPCNRADQSTISRYMARHLLTMHDRTSAGFEFSLLMHSAILLWGNTPARSRRAHLGPHTALYASHLLERAHVTSLIC